MRSELPSRVTGDKCDRLWGNFKLCMNLESFQLISLNFVAVDQIMNDLVSFDQDVRDPGVTLHESGSCLQVALVVLQALKQAAAAIAIRRTFQEIFPEADSVSVQERRKLTPQEME